MICSCCGGTITTSFRSSSDRGTHFTGDREPDSRRFRNACLLQPRSYLTPRVDHRFLRIQASYAAVPCRWSQPRWHQGWLEIADSTPSVPHTSQAIEASQLAHLSDPDPLLAEQRPPVFLKHPPQPEEALLSGWREDAPRSDGNFKNSSSKILIYSVFKHESIKTLPHRRKYG